MSEELPCNHITVRWWHEPFHHAVVITCPNCGQMLSISDRDLMRTTSERSAFTISMRIAGAFGELWGNVVWQQLKPKDKR